MPNLSQLVDNLVERPGVDAVLLFSSDGLPIQHRSRAPLEPEAAAALGATLIREVMRLGGTVARGPAATAVLEYERGLAIITRFGDTDWLLLLADPDADVGELLHDLRQHRPAFAALL